MPNEVFQTNGQLYNLSDGIQSTNPWQFNYTIQHQSTGSALFCGPGRKRYLIAFLCCACLTVVIGMRSEMLGIITNLNNTNSRLTLGFKYAINHNDDYAMHTLHNTQYTNQTNQLKEVNQLNLIQHNEDKQMNDENVDENDNHHQLNSHRLLHNRRYSTALIFKPSEHRKMPWTETIKNDLVENAVFFAYLITSPIGGYLTVNYDSSFLLGSSVAITCAVFGILRYWSPENERSTLVCLAVIGVSLGPLIGLPVCAEIEKKWGWGVVFYIYANLGLIWCIFWWRLIDEKPTKDKKLNKHELHYLQTTIPKRILYNYGYTQIPWQKIFTSRPVYAILFTYAADDWTFQISSVCMQSFYQQIYNVDVERTIFFLSFPFLSRSMFVPI
ncbi:Vesicular glutamate transporter 2, partial [Schistosoma japonicum]